MSTYKQLHEVEPSVWTGRLWTSGRSDDEVFAKLEQELGPLDEKLRDKLDRLVLNYWFDNEPNQTVINKTNKQLTAIADAARALHTILTEPLPCANEDAELERALKHTWNFIRSKTGINVRYFAYELNHLISFLTRTKNKGGRPTNFAAWNKLMLGVADIYEEAMGPKSVADFFEKLTRHKKAGAMRHKAGVSFSPAYKGQKYYRPFVRVATIIDHETAAFAGVKPRSNSELGAALRQLLKARRASASDPSQRHK